MSAVIMILSASEAQRLTQRIKLTAGNVREGLFRLRNLVDEAKKSNAWQILGFPSWTAYLADTLADEPMRVGREERLQLVGYLSGEGLSTRAIAPIIGVDQATVVRARRDANASPEPPVEHPQEITSSAPVEAVTAPTAPPTGSAVTVNPATAEIVDAEVPTPLAPQPIVGLDGKTYAPKPPNVKPPVTGDDVALLNAETESKALGRALMTLTGMKVPAHRNRIITEWWPRGNDSVPPDSRALFEPRAIRDIATWLMQLADDLEVAP